MSKHTCTNCRRQLMERLRNHVGGNTINETDAADEIERLTADRHALLGAAEKTAELVMRLGTEITLLRAELDAADQLMQHRSRMAYGYNPDLSMCGLWLDNEWVGGTYRDVFKRAAEAAGGKNV